MKKNRQHHFMFVALSRKKSLNERGLTLIEIMVAMALMLVVLAAVILNMSSTTKAGVFQRNYSQTMETGQTALNILSRQIRNAGYQQLVEVPPYEKPRFGEFILGCSSPSVNTTHGSVTTWVAACNGSDNTSDSIAVRYQGGNDLISLPGFDAGNLVFATQDCTGADVSGATNEVDRGDGTKITIIDNRFFLNGDNLVCSGNGSGASAILVSGIEQLRIWYGVANRTPYHDGTGVEVLLPQVSQYVTAAQLKTKYASDGVKMWDHVVSVRLCVVAKSDSAIGVPPGSKYMDCDGSEQDMGNAFRRAMYTTIDVPNAGVGL